MKSADTQLTGFMAHVEQTGSGGTSMTVVRLNKHPIKEHTVEWWVRLLWGRGSFLPAVHSAADKVLVWAGKRKKAA